MLRLKCLRLGIAAATEYASIELIATFLSEAHKKPQRVTAIAVTAISISIIL